MSLEVPEVARKLSQTAVLVHGRTGFKFLECSFLLKIDDKQVRGHMKTGAGKSSRVGSLDAMLLGAGEKLKSL